MIVFHTCHVSQPLFAMAYWAMRKELRNDLDATGHELKNAVWALFSNCKFSLYVAVNWTSFVRRLSQAYQAVYFLDKVNSKDAAKLVLLVSIMTVYFFRTTASGYSIPKNKVSSTCFDCTEAAVCSRGSPSEPHWLANSPRSTLRRLTLNVCTLETHPLRRWRCKLFQEIFTKYLIFVWSS